MRGKTGQNSGSRLSDTARLKSSGMSYDDELATGLGAAGADGTRVGRRATPSRKTSLPAPDLLGNLADGFDWQSLERHPGYDLLLGEPNPVVLPDLHPGAGKATNTLSPTLAISKLIKRCPTVRRRLVARLGCGQMGCVYALRDSPGAVLKLTFEGPEAAAALVMQELQARADVLADEKVALPRIDEVFVVPACGLTKGGAALFAIQREDLADLHGYEADPDATDDLGEVLFGLSGLSERRAREAAGNLADKWSLRLPARSVMDAWRTLQRLKREGVWLEDLHTGNWGLRFTAGGPSEVQLVIRDFGVVTLSDAMYTRLRAGAPPALLAGLDAAGWTRR